MSFGAGHDSRCALGVESTYETAVAVTELIPFTSESLNKVIAMIESEYLDGSPSRKNMQNSLITVQGDLSVEVVYDEIAGDPIGIERLLRGLFGNSERDGSNNLNQYKLANALDDHYTLCFGKGVSVWELVSAKFGSMELSGNVGEKLMMTVGNIIAADIYRTGDGGLTNSLAAVNALAPTNIPSNVLIEDAVVRIANLDDALASGDQYCIEGFTLSMNNNLSDPQHATVCSTNSNALTGREPFRNGFRETDLTIRMPRYETDAFFSFNNADTPLQADIKFSLGSYEFNILLPYIKINNPQAPISGPEMIKQEISFTCLRNAGRNTDLTFQDSDAITDELGIECKSARTSAA